MQKKKFDMKLLKILQLKKPPSSKSQNFQLGILPNGCMKNDQAILLKEQYL